MSDSPSFESLAFNGFSADGEWRATQIFFVKKTDAAPIAKIAYLLSTTDDNGNIKFTKQELNLIDYAPNGVTCIYYVKE